jgi:hypothetical protein
MRLIIKHDPTTLIFSTAVVHESDKIVINLTPRWPERVSTDDETGNIIIQMENGREAALRVSHPATLGEPEVEKDQVIIPFQRLE